MKGKTERQLGVVISFDRRKGFGFIRAADGREIFVHFSDIRTTNSGFRFLTTGEEVEFHIYRGQKGEQAGDVIRLTPPKEEPFEPLGGRRTW